MLLWVFRRAAFGHRLKRNRGLGSDPDSPRRRRFEL